MKAIVQFWNRPYVYAFKLKARLLQGAAYGLFVCFFLGVFAPFQINEMPQGLWASAALFGSVTTICIWMLAGLFTLYPKLINENSWTVGKEISANILHIGIIGLGNYALFLFLIGAKPHVLNLLIFELYTLSIGVFPVTAYTAWREFRQRTFYQQGASEVQLHWQSRAQLEKSESYQEEHPTLDKLTKSFFLLKAASSTDDLTLKLSDLIYVQAADNYLEIHYLNGNKGLSKHLMRQTLKALCEQLADKAVFLRCHKSYLVNVMHVVKVIGNAQGFRLVLAHTPQTIPVSRSLNNTLSECLTIGHNAL